MDRKFWIGCISLLVVLGICLSIYPPGDSSSVASWVQAIGAIGAIFLAIWLSKAQFDQAAKLQELARIDRLLELYAPAIAIIEAVIKKLENSLEDARNGRKNFSFGVDQSFYSGRDKLKEAFFAIPVHQMPSVPSATCVLRVQELFESTDEMVNHLGGKFDTMVTVTSEDLAAFVVQVGHWKAECDQLKYDLVKVSQPPPKLK